MVEATFVDALIVGMLILVIGLYFEARIKSNSRLEEYDFAIDEIKNSLNVVAQVLNQIPSMVPQFQINQNPLAQILEFFQSRNQESSISGPPLRDDNGRFENHAERTTEEQENEQTPI